MCSPCCEAKNNPQTCRIIVACWICFRKQENVHAFFIIFQNWNDAATWNLSLWITRACLYCTLNNIADNDVWKQPWYWPNSPGMFYFNTRGINTMGYGCYNEHLKANHNMGWIKKPDYWCSFFVNWILKCYMMLKLYDVNKMLTCNLGSPLLIFHC